MGFCQRLPRIRACPPPAPDQVFNPPPVGSFSPKPLNDSGAILPMLGEPQLREIGFGLVGPRMQFQKELQEIQRGVSALPCFVMGLLSRYVWYQARMKQRNEVLWEVPQTIQS